MMPAQMLHHGGHAGEKVLLADSTRIIRIELAPQGIGAEGLEIVRLLGFLKGLEKLVLGDCARTRRIDLVEQAAHLGGGRFGSARTRPNLGVGGVQGVNL